MILAVLVYVWLSTKTGTIKSIYQYVITCLYIYTCMSIRVFLYMHLCPHDTCGAGVRMAVRKDRYICIYICVLICLRIYICQYVYIYICIYVHMNVHKDHCLIVYVYVSIYLYTYDY
jgi:nuclear pore complex protein Nup62